MGHSATRRYKRRRSARYAARHRQSIVRVGVWAGVVFICFSFAGGFVWKKSGLQRAPKELAPATVGPAQRAEALRLFDEAVRARYEERLQGAVAVINEVRRLDSELPGIDVFIGEVALQQKDVWTLRKAADASLQRRANVAPALLLLAVEKWMGRLSEGAGEAGSAARSLLQEAAQHEPSHSAVYFFLGEVNRFLGKVPRRTATFCRPCTVKLLGEVHLCWPRRSSRPLPKWPVITRNPQASRCLTRRSRPSLILAMPQSGGSFFTDPRHRSEALASCHYDKVTI